MAVWTIGDGDATTGSDTWWGDLGIASGVPFDPLKLYRITFGDVRVISGGGNVYLGWMGYDVNQDKNSILGSNVYNWQHYHAASRSIPIVTTTFVGYTQGYGSPNGSGAVGTLASPSLVHADVAFLRPLMLINNISSGIGVTEVGSIIIDEVDATNTVLANLATYTPDNTIYWARAAGGWVMPQNDRASSAIIVNRSFARLPDYKLGDTICVPFTTHLGGQPASPNVPFTIDDFSVYRGCSSGDKKATSNGMTITTTFDGIEGIQVLNINTNNVAGEDPDYWSKATEYLIVASNGEAPQDGEPGLAAWVFSIEKTPATQIANQQSQLILATYNVVTQPGKLNIVFTCRPDYLGPIIRGDNYDGTLHPKIAIPITTMVDVTGATGTLTVRRERTDVIVAELPLDELVTIDEPSGSYEARFVWLNAAADETEISNYKFDVQFNVGAGQRTYANGRCEVKEDQTR